MIVVPLMAAIALQLATTAASGGSGTSADRDALDPGGPSCESMGIHCDSGRGLIRDSTLGLTEVVWVGPEPRGVYVSALASRRHSRAICVRLRIGI